LEENLRKGLGKNIKVRRNLEIFGFPYLKNIKKIKRNQVRERRRKR
jgi:hypothetical protein